MRPSSSRRSGPVGGGVRARPRLRLRRRRGGVAPRRGAAWRRVIATTSAAAATAAAAMAAAAAAVAARASTRRSIGSERQRRARRGGASAAPASRRAVGPWRRWNSAKVRPHGWCSVAQICARAANSGSGAATTAALGATGRSRNLLRARIKRHESPRARARAPWRLAPPPSRAHFSSPMIGALLAAASLADWRSSFSTGRYDVAIVGSGPKESLLAGLLAASGGRCCSSSRRRRRAA